MLRPRLPACVRGERERDESPQRRCLAARGVARRHCARLRGAHLGDRATPHVAPLVLVRAGCDRPGAGGIAPAEAASTEGRRPGAGLLARPARRRTHRARPHVFRAANSAHAGPGAARAAKTSHRARARASGSRWCRHARPSSSRGPRGATPTPCSRSAGAHSTSWSARSKRCRCTSSAERFTAGIFSARFATRPVRHAVIP